MNRSDEPLFDPRIADWLEDDPYEAPQQALDVVLAAFPSITQRHAARVPWRFLDMSSPLKLAFAAAAIAVVVGGVLFLGPWRPASNVAAPATASPPASPSPAAATSSPTVPPVTGLPGTFVFRRDDGDGKDVFLMQPDRSGLVQLTTDPKLDSAPVLSPDGTRVAFERTDPDAGNADIWIVNADGTNEIPITQTDQVEDWPSWSPDGTRLLFTRTSLQDTVETSEIAIRTVAPDCSASAAGVGHGRVPTGESPGRRDGTCADVVAGWIVDRVHLGQGRREAAIHDPCRRLQPEEADHGRRDEPARLVPGLVDDRLPGGPD